MSHNNNELKKATAEVRGFPEWEFRIRVGSKQKSELRRVSITVVRNGQELGKLEDLNTGKGLGKGGGQSFYTVSEFIYHIANRENMPRANVFATNAANAISTQLVLIFRSLAANEE